MTRACTNPLIEDRGGGARVVYARPSRLVLAKGIECIVSPEKTLRDLHQGPRTSIRFSLLDNAAVVAIDGRRAETHDPEALVVRIEAPSPLMLELPQETGTWYLTPELRSILISVRRTEISSPRDELHLSAKLLDLVCCVIDGVSRKRFTPTEGSATLSEVETTRMLMAREIIYQRFAESLSIDKIARECGTNRTLLCRCFRQAFGRSVTQHLAKARLEEACRLLETSDLTVATVAFRCGYRNNAAFARAFSRRFGISPSAHRRDAHRLGDTAGLLQAA